MFGAHEWNTMRMEWEWEWNGEGMAWNNTHSHSLLWQPTLNYVGLNDHSHVWHIKQME